MLHRVAGVICAIVVAALSNEAPALAATPTILLSTDGVSYAPALSAGLFDDIGRLVPRDMVTRTLWVQNASTEPARFQLASLGGTASGVDISQVVSIGAGYAGGAAARPVAAVGCAELLPSSILDPGQISKIDVTVLMGDAPARVAHDQSVDLDLLASLSDPAGPAPDACPAGGTVIPIGSDPGASGALSFTGASIQVGVVGGALLAVAAGVWLFVTGRRRKRRAAESQ